MAQVRNVTDSVLYLAAVGREVAPDELCEVPDDVFAALVPESTWAVVAESASKKPNKEK